MKVLVIGANGNFGRPAVRGLVERGASVRGLASNSASARAVASNGAEPVIGDFRDADSLRSAMRGVDKVYHIHPPLLADEHRIARNSIEAAKAEGVRHFVFHALIHPHIPDLPLHWNKLLAMSDLIHAGLPHTVLQPSSTMQNIEWAWKSIIEDGIWPIAFRPEARLSWVDREDVAQAAVNVLLEPGHEGGHYELTATPPMSMVEVAALASRHLNRAVRVQRLPWREFCAQPYWTSRFSADRLQQLELMFGHVDRHGLHSGNPRTLQMLLGRPCAGWEAVLGRLPRY